MPNGRRGARKTLVLLGAGGHARSVADALRHHPAWEVVGILDHQSHEGASRFGLSILGGDDMIPALVADGHAFAIGIGQLEPDSPRHELFRRLDALGATIPPIVAPSAYVSEDASLSDGAQVLHNATVNAGAVIGPNTIVNSHALIEHDAETGAHCHVATGAILNGHSAIGDHVVVGSRATILQQVTVSSRVVVGAGAVVTQALEAPGTYVGVPARGPR